MLVLSTRLDKVFVEYPHISSRAGYLLLREVLVKRMLEEWEVFRNTFFDEFEKEHHTLFCCYCKKPGLVREIPDPCNKEQLKTLATIEHLVPLSNGGEKYNMSNCTVACFPCNNRRGNKNVL